MDRFNKYMNGKYDLIHSSYSIYYSSNPKKLLQECYKRLNKNGKIIITVPCFPHTLVEETNLINKIPLNVIQSINFYKEILLPFIQRKFTKIKINKFKNILKISNKKDFLNIYRATTYYNKNTEKSIYELISLSDPHNLKKTIFIYPEGIITSIYLRDLKFFRDIFGLAP